MYSFRITNKVSSRLKEIPAQNPPGPTTLLGDWYVNLLIIRRQHILLLVSERTLLPILMPAKDLAHFPERFSQELHDMLRALKIPPDKIQAELNQMKEWHFAKTASRQILGSMNDFVNMLGARRDDDEPLLQQALWLAESPCSPIGMDSPLEATTKVFGEKFSRRPLLSLV